MLTRSKVIFPELDSGSHSRSPWITPSITKNVISLMVERSYTLLKTYAILNRITALATPSGKENSN